MVKGIIFVSNNDNKMSKRKLLNLFLVFIFFVCVLPLKTIASPIDPGCDPLDQNPPPGCPIDGGLTILIAAGIGLGAKKAFKNGNKSNI